MHLIVYTSQLSVISDDIDAILQSIEKIAKVENAKHGITGVLLFFKGKFLQIIEGDEAKLQSLMKNITHDTRHNKIQILIDQKIDKRGFSEWNMDSFNLDGKKLVNFESLKKLTESFKRNLLPNSDELMFYYKALLGLEDRYRVC